MKYFLIAGEPSGDQHGSNLMKAILNLDPAAEFRFLGGDLMERVGGKAIIHIRDLAFMGFTQLVAKAFRIRKNFAACKQAVLSFQPDVVIPVDYGGFNLRLIKWLRKNQFRSVFYITPKVWAWMPSRANKLARYADRSLCVLPFETDFLRKYGVLCDYVGNPVKDYIRPFKDSDPAWLRSAMDLDSRPVVALLPGSRRQEIAKILPLMAKMADKFIEYQFIIGGHGNFTESFYQDLAPGQKIRVIYGKTPELLRVSTAALVTSGTATLECALLGTPQVVCYRTATISWLIARLLIKVRYISLVNLVLGKECVKELIQFGFTEKNLKASLGNILTDPLYRQHMADGYSELEGKLGDQDASASAAAIVCRMASESR